MCWLWHHRERARQAYRVMFKLRTGFKEELARGCVRESDGAEKKACARSSLCENRGVHKVQWRVRGRQQPKPGKMEANSELAGVRIQGPCCPADLWLLHNGVGSVVHVTATYLKTQQSTQRTVMVGYTIALSLVIWEKQTNRKCWEFTPREPIFHYDCTERMWEQKSMGRTSKQAWEIWMKRKVYFIFPEWMTLQLNLLLSSKTEEFYSLFIFLKKKSHSLLPDCLAQGNVTVLSGGGKSKK